VLTFASLCLLHLPGPHHTIKPRKKKVHLCLYSNVHGWALSQLWLFWVAPIAGAAIAGLVYNLVFAETPSHATNVVVAKPEFDTLPGTSAAG